MPRSDPPKKPPSASLNVNQPAGQSVCRSSQKLWTIADGFGSRNCCTWKSAMPPCQTTIAPTKTTSAGSHSPSRRATGRARRHSQCLLFLGKQVLAAAAQELPHGGHELEEARLLARLDRSRVRQVDVDGAGDPAGPRAHDDHARGQEDRLRDRVGDEDDGRAELLPDREQLEVQPLARHLVERAERLVHQQERRLERERARDRDALLHAARELPRMVVGEADELDELEHLLDPLLALRAIPAEELERHARCSSRRCASRRARRPGRRSRSRDRRAPASRTCRSRARCRSSARSGRRSRAEASTCRTPTGRSARRTRPAATRARCPGAR